MAQWYYKIDGETHGPISDRRLLRRIVKGRLTDDHLICRDGMREFISVHDYRLLNPEMIADAEAATAEKKRRKEKRDRRRKERQAEAPPVEIVTNPKVVVGRPPVINVQDAPPPPATQNLRDRTHSQLAPRTTRSGNSETRKYVLIAMVAVICLAILFGGSYLISTAASRSENSVANNDTNSSGKSDSGKSERGALAEKNSDAKKVDAEVSKKKEDAKTEDSRNEIARLDAKGRGDAEKSNVAPAVSETTRVPPFDNRSPVIPDSPIKIDQPTPKTAPSGLPSNPSPKPESKNADQKDHQGLQDLDVVVVYQTIDVHRKPKFVVQGLPFDQNLQYTVQSEIKVGKLLDNGFRDVRQTVIGAKLIEADAMSKASMSEAIDELEGQSFTFKLNKRQEVIDFKMESGDTGKVIEVEKPFNILDTEGFRITSVIDSDGWKELAQLTFFMPKQEETWQGQMRHDWDSLGFWEGVTDYRRVSEQKNLLEIDYVYNMLHKPPTEAGPAGLPFEIESAKFVAESTSGGKIQFDTSLGRIASVTENFHVSGDLDTSILGQKAKVKIEEVQIFTITLNDQKASQ